MLRIFTAGFSILLLLSCTKTNVAEQPKQTEEKIEFTKYTIDKGNQFCNDNSYVTTSYRELRFIAKFDSTAIYTTVNPGNQDDINKLYGFADNNATHHKYSARFGWRWSKSALRLFGYVYNHGVLDSKELGTVEIGKENNCSIKITPSAYHFLLNGKIDSLPRMSTTLNAQGYKLYPYFGGDEVAPHTINIFIKESKN